MKTILIILCVIPTLALAETKLNFKDKTSMCGAYELKGNQYCKSVGGGEMCWEKADIVSVETVGECEQMGFAGGSSSGATSYGHVGPHEFTAEEKAGFKREREARAKQIEETRNKKIPGRDDSR